MMLFEGVRADGNRGKGLGKPCLDQRIMMVRRAAPKGQVQLGSLSCQKVGGESEMRQG